MNTQAAPMMPAPPMQQPMAPQQPGADDILGDITTELKSMLESELK
jgi:hypothetical protein